MKKLRLYTRPHCELCNEARDILTEAGADWEEINILENAELEARYRHEVPVIQSGGVFWFCRDRATMPLARWLRKARRQEA